MHGTGVYLPKKIPFFTTICRNLQADIIVFAYRGFSYSDGVTPRGVDGITRDSEAITAYFAKAIEERGGPRNVEAIMWGKSFGCSTALSSHLKNTSMHETLVLEAPFTNVDDVLKSLVPCLGRCFACLNRIVWRNDQTIVQVKVPVLIICGTRDPLTPIWMAR